MNFLTKKTVIFLIFIMLINVVGAFAEGQQDEGYLPYKAPESPASSWFSTIVYILSLLVTFGVIIFLAYFTSRFLGKRFAKSYAQGDNRVIITLSLGTNRAISVVEVAGKILVIGVTDHNVNLLQEIDDPDEVAKLKSTNGDAEPFDTIFERHFNSLNKLSNKFPSAFNDKRGANNNERE